MRPLLLLCVALAVAGCDSALTDADGFSATLTTDGFEYAPGAEAELRVENTGTVPIAFGPPSCYAKLESERTEGAWGPVTRDDTAACATVVVVLPPGEAAVSTIPLDVEPGTYRLRLDVSDEEEELRLSTAPFVVG